MFMNETNHTKGDFRENAISDNRVVHVNICAQCSLISQSDSAHFVGTKLQCMENMDWYVTSKFTYVWNLKRLLQIFNELNGSKSILNMEVLSLIELVCSWNWAFADSKWNWI